MTTQELMAKKLKTAKNEHRVSTNVLRILADLRKYVPPEDLPLFNRALVSPQGRRQSKSAQSVLFWQDQDAVEQWMGRDDHYSSAMIYNNARSTKTIEDAEEHA